MKDRRLELTTDPLAPLRRMMEIRELESRIQALFDEGHVRGTTHLAIGQEAVAVALAAATTTADTVSCTYRGHSHAVALGVSLVQVVGEILGRRRGCAGGMGGSMHLVSAEAGLHPTSAIVGAGIPVAAGAAFAARFKGSDSVAVAVFGDGTLNIGAFHETANIASVLGLPLLLLCENNLYGEYSPMALTTAGIIADRPKAYRIPYIQVDGQDYAGLHRTLAHVVEDIRATGGPRFVEAMTYRYSGHSRSDPGTYRPDGELEQWLQRDPLQIESQRLIEGGYASEPSAEAIRDEAIAAVDIAVESAFASEEPAAHAMFEHVLAP